MEAVLLQALQVSPESIADPHLTHTKDLGWLLGRGGGGVDEFAAEAECLDSPELAAASTGQATGRDDLAPQEVQNCVVSSAPQLVQ